MEIIAPMYLKYRLQCEKNKFFKSCVSEGFLPKGIQGKFNVAIDVNDEQFVNETQVLMNNHGSRMLDVVFIHSQKIERKLQCEYEAAIESVQIPNHGDLVYFSRALTQMKRNCWPTINGKEKSLKSKLKSLRRQKSAGTPPLVQNQGSRKIKGFIYVKKEDSGLLNGAPFPQYIRPHRRNRPTRERFQHPASRQHVVTQEDMAARDPIVLTKNQDFLLTEAGKSVMRLGPKTAPTPMTTVDEKAQIESW